MDTAGSIAVHGIGFDAEPAARLYDELSRLTVIDAHEHLMPEHERIRRAPDAVSLFEAYPRMVLQVSGMPADDLAAMSERSAPVEERCARLAPHLPHVRELALTRALMIGIRELYGIERIDDDTYLQATETLRAANRAGLYERTFRDRMRVAAALNQQYDSDDPPWTMPAPGSFRLTQMWESQLNFACKPEPLALIERAHRRPGAHAGRLRRGAGAGDRRGPRAGRARHQAAQGGAARRSRRPPVKGRTARCATTSPTPSSGRRAPRE